jgi:hypothetical protein
MSRQTLSAQDIVVGKALPFSVYGADNTLLLAKGQVVTERIREGLLRNGVRPVYSAEERAAAEERIEVPQSCPLQVFRNAYSRGAGSARIGFRMSRDDRGESYTAWVLGTHEQRGLMLSAPVSRDNSLVAMADGQTWVFRAFHGTAAFRFAGIVRKVMFEPLPYFHLQLPPTIDMRRVRQRPRAQVCLPVAISRESPQAGGLDGVIADLSSCGLRLAMKQGDVLQKDQSLHLRFSIALLDRSHDLQVTAQVVAAYGAADQRHPGVHLYGLSLTACGDFEQMLLHAYVHERLVNELDSIWRILAGSSGTPSTQESGVAA